MNGTKKAIRILLVDDYEIFRHGLRAMLESEDDIEVVGECASAEEAVELVVSPPDDKAQLLRFVWQLEERRKGTYGAAVVTRTAGSFERGAVITVLVLPDALASLSETVEKMPEVEKVEELLEEDALSTLPRKPRLPLSISISPSKRMSVTLKA